MTSEQKKVVRTFLDSHSNIVSKSKGDWWVFARFAVGTVNHPDYDKEPPGISRYLIKVGEEKFNLITPKQKPWDWTQEQFNQYASTTDKQFEEYKRKMINKATNENN